MTNPANSASRKARWATAIAAGVVLAAIGAGTLPAVASAAERPAAPVTGIVHTREPLDRAALQASLDGLPDVAVNGALARVSGRDGRWSGAAGPTVPSAEANFRIGSVTKVFTSTVTLQLVAEGRLTLDTPVQQVLPGTLPADWAPITVGQLLSHTSGMPHPVAPSAGTTPASAIADALRVAVEEGAPTPAPGVRQQYNGLNHLLLGMAIEKTTGRTYAEEVQRRIARPLGLRHTYVPAADDHSLPAPHTRALWDASGTGTGELVDNSRQSPWAWAEGGMISNAPELDRFFTALMNGRLLPPAQQKLLTEPVPGFEGNRTFSRGGLQHMELSPGTWVWGKTGSYNGYTSGVFINEERSRVLVYSLNPTNRRPQKPEDGLTELDHVFKIARATF
ncbi:serine hydrolase [Streptomyces katrae]|uniref:Serine hydrolase n=1 Tax=Streptomyces katrae TaxID=68223 RepID=A0ABT7H3Z7_9ACTN|nr:serine hydrolase domain-containing protein [Streptomyces katrae]MDK9499849.1 serine hydrolase [Streptomyces katrae]